MEPKEMPIKVDEVEIPDELARELSELLTTQTIKMDMLRILINNGEKHDTLEKELVPIVSKIEAIKYKITNEFIPKQYSSIQYIWNYNGYEIDGNKIEIIRAD